MSHDQIKICHFANLVVTPLRVAMALGWILSLTPPCVIGQSKKRETQVLPPPIYSGLEAAREHYGKLFKPDFAKLNLRGSSLGDDDKHSKSSVELFNVGNNISLSLMITNASKDEVVVYSQLDLQILNRPQLYRDGELVSYPEGVKELLQAKDKRISDGRSKGYVLQPGKSITETIDLGYWYEPLKPGRYELSVWHRFIWGGEWVESPSVMFEVVVPMKPETPAQL